MRWSTTVPGPKSFFLLSSIVVCVIIFALAYSGDEKIVKAADKQAMMEMVKLAPARGYLEAHKGVEHPLEIVGGPIRVHVTQDVGGVFVALPSVRRLDPNVVGTPKYPRAFGGAPLINGIPLSMRKVEDGKYTTTTVKTPTGDLNHIVLPNGRMKLEALDVTATDAATTNDQVKFEATWQDRDGNTYGVTCCKKMIPHGNEMPTFGGVVTNHMLHGFTRLWTAMMPTFFTYVAFWGVGDILKNGEVVDESRLIHGMLTEYIRTEGYKMAFDHQVTPTRLHFHVMVFPVKTDAQGHFMKAPIKTGFMLPNGKQLPFWHVMFENLKIDSERDVSLSRAESYDRDGVGSIAKLARYHISGSETTVILTNKLTFEKSVVQIKIGDKVRWKNTSDLVHSVTVDPELAALKENVQLPNGAETFNSGDLLPGEEFSHTFTVPGTYKYFCIPHEGAKMLGTVVVSS
ncbi:MAG: hypothetical protein IID61_00740 [SAR324 cluster bacterium]|nr:hypothetical protein [SAR324 cluster bacterium]